MCQREFPQLQLLNFLSDELLGHRPNLFEGVCVVGVQHLLETTGSLCEALVKLGADPRDIYLLGKHYSTSPIVERGLLKRHFKIRASNAVGRVGGFANDFENSVKEMWNTALSERRLQMARRVIVLDDGGHCISTIPNELLKQGNVAAVEQTSSGIARIGAKLRCPVVNVAQSATKRLLEARLITETIVNKAIPGLLPDLSPYPTSRRGQRIGVIGMGAIGKAMAESLYERGYEVRAFDQNGDGTPVIGCRSIDELIDRSDVIFGCSGVDAIGTGWLPDIRGQKLLLSCSSEDVEFRSLLDKILVYKSKAGSRDHEMCLPMKNGTVRVLKNGFPVNFSGDVESVPAEHIQITRASLLLGMAQAVSAQPEDKLMQLDPWLQSTLATKWFEDKNNHCIELYEKKIIEYFRDPNWVKAQSWGAPASYSILM